MLKEGENLDMLKKKKKKWGGLAGSFTINVLWSRKIQNHNQRERKDGTWRESLVGSKSFL